MPTTKPITAVHRTFSLDGPPKCVCPAWCELEPGHGDGEGCLAHIAAAYELEDRVELCVIQVISTDAKDLAHSPDRPAEFYFWATDEPTLDVNETAELAEALRHAAEVLAGILAARGTTIPLVLSHV